VDCAEDLEEEMSKELTEAVKVLATYLKIDSGLWLAYQANIAMAFVDEYNKHVNEQKDIHKIANKAADNFLKQLTYDVQENKF
jgi:hypothetical protein